jgi:thioredoxin-like negative regulator of GroEL
MFERVIALSLFLILAYLLIRKFQFSKISADTLPFKINNLNPSLPTILYFWTDQCSQCNSVQKPAIIKLKDDGNEFNFVSFNAIKELKLTKHLNIKTVPSTVILNSEKNIRFINNGYISSAVLEKQLNKI